jgi:hypothetical protein
MGSLDTLAGRLNSSISIAIQWERERETSPQRQREPSKQAKL